jgi:IclR family transcriptional regulator, acetate operon repressor
MVQSDSDQHESRSRPAYLIGSVDNALRVILMFEDESELRVADVSKRLGVAMSTAHRLLNALQYRGFIIQHDRTRGYAPGPALLSIGLAAVRHMSLRDKARSHLEGLHERTDETVHLAIMMDRNVVYIDAIESTKPVRVAQRIGGVDPVHCTSVGKAMLAALPETKVNRLYPRERLSGRTAHSIHSRSDLMEALRETTRNGYAVNWEETELDVGSAAAAVCDLGGHPLGAFSVAAPKSRLDQERMVELGRAVKEAAAQVSESL